MEPFGIGITGLGVAGMASLGAFGLAFRQRRRRMADAEGRQPRSLGERLEALAAAQAALGLRLEALAAEGQGPEERLQAVAGQLLGLIRDKNATLETALAGLDQLRARMRALEQMGEPAEARALLEKLDGRLDRMEASATAQAATLEVRLAGLEATAGPGGAAELAERLATLQEKRDAGLEAALARFGPLETRLGGLEGGVAPLRDALRRLETRIEAMGSDQSAARAELAAVRAEAGGPLRALAEDFAQLEARTEALAGEALGRLAALDREMAARDPQGALDRFAERLEAVRVGLAGEIEALRTEGTPFAAVSEQLTALYAQKDATVETVFARLAPLEAKLAEMEGGVARLDPQTALDRFGERLEAVRAGLVGEIEALRTEGTPFVAVSEQLASLYAQKDAAVETVLARLAPLEAKLAEMEGGVARLDPQAALDRFAERLEAVRSGLAGEIEALRTEGTPFAAVSEQLTALYAQKDAAVETVFARLVPLEAKLAEMEGGVARLAPLAEADPRAAVEGLRARIEALHWAHGEVAAGLSALEARAAAGGDPAAPLAEVAAQLTRLYAQKDAVASSVVARLGPLEERLAALEARPGDPDAEEAKAQAEAIAAGLARQTALFADRLTALEASLPRLSAARIAAMEEKRASGVTEEKRASGGMEEKRASGATEAGDIAGPGIAAGATEGPVEVAPETRPVPEAPEVAEGVPNPVWSLPRIVSLHHSEARAGRGANPGLTSSPEPAGRAPSFP